MLKRMGWGWAGFLSLVVLSACATMPDHAGRPEAGRAKGTRIGSLDTDQPQDFRETQKAISGSQARLAAAAKWVLEQEGYRVVRADPARLQTDPRQVQLELGFCTYGSSPAQDPALDETILERIELIVTLDDNRVRIRSNLTAGTLVNGQFQSLNRVCVSSGRLEEELLSKIQQAVTELP